MATCTNLSDRAKRVLRESIPDRIAELYACASIIEACEDLSEPTASAVVELANTVTVTYSSVRLFVQFPYLDAAIITCRNLLQLMGIGLSGNGLTVTNYSNRKHPTDVWMTDFGLQPVPKHDAYKGHGSLTESEVEKILLVVLQAANKGIAHLTDASTRDRITPEEVIKACRIVTTLVNRHVYTAKVKKTIDLPTETFGRIAVERKQA